VFRRAFPASSPEMDLSLIPSPQLHILVAYADPSSRELQWLQACCAHDPRIKLRGQQDCSFREQLLPLMASAHVWLSLQRSYPLPALLGTAQAMGLQVIATSSGAALDLHPSPNLHLVPARQVSIGRGALLDAEGFAWGEPDQDAAVAALQLAVALPRLPQFSIAVEQGGRSGRVMRDRLVQLWTRHCSI
ncbi:MAG: hypothetical protein ACKO8I_05850, partial [Cyanobacteriota bacterium]